MNELKVGDTVCLNANPECKMDIESIKGDIATCIGFDGKKPYKQDFNVVVLSPCERPIPEEKSVIILPAKDIHND